VTRAASDWVALTADEIRARLDRPAVGLWALGATEQHGPHLATGFDFIAAETVVRRAADELGDEAIVLPTLPFGCSEYWLELGGTLSLAQSTLKHAIGDICRSAARAGLRRLVIVNGHSGNTGVAVTAVTELGASDLLVEFVSYWDIIDRERLTLLQDIEGGFGHAGEMETSIGLHLGEVVREGRIPVDGEALDPSAPGGWGVVFHRAPRADVDSRGGVIGDPGAASAAVGEAVLEMAVQGLVEHCRAALDGRPPAIPRVA
jgi:creatinine amidohydrolase